MLTLTHQQITDGQTYATSYVYNLSGGIVSETYPSMRTVNYDINADGDLSRVWGQVGQASRLQRMLLSTMRREMCLSKRNSIRMAGRGRQATRTERAKRSIGRKTSTTPPGECSRSNHPTTPKWKHSTA